MKSTITLLITLLILIVTFFGCKNNENEKTISYKDEPKTSIGTNLEVDSNVQLNLDTIDYIRVRKEEKNDSLKKIYRTKRLFIPYYVNAKSGLNYRETPNGKIKGVFPVNTRLIAILHTDTFSQIIDKTDTLKGEWLGIEFNNDTVFIFSEFLSYSFTFSEIEIFTATPYYEKKGRKTRTAFINLSEKYFSDSEQNSVFMDDNVNEPRTFNSTQRRKFLSAMNISESDSVFVYEFSSDSLHTYRVKELPIITREDIYFGDIEYGFDLGINYKYSYFNFVFVGKENPFDIGKLKPVIWKEIDSLSYSKLCMLDKSFDLVNTEVTRSKKFSYKLNDYDYYLLGRYRLIIANKNEIVLDKIYSSSESSSPTIPKMENDILSEPSQWTGILFKNEKPVVFGFLNRSFSCEIINFLDKNEPPISILCDCRH